MSENKRTIWKSGSEGHFSNASISLFRTARLRLAKINYLFFSTDFFPTDFAEKERLLVVYQLAGSKPVGYLQVKSWNRTKDYQAINRSGGQGGVGPKMPDYEPPRSPQNH